VGRPEGKRPLWRPRRRCGDNIKIHLQGIELGRELCLSSSVLDKWRVDVDTVMELRVS
jgi:hypothetical protein